MPVEQKDKTIELQLGSSSVTIYHYGATITSWKTNGLERLFLSSKAILDGTKAVRGGIPLVFPVFGQSQSPHPTSSLPQHGVARTSIWKFLGSSVIDTNEEVTVVFELNSSDVSEDLRSKWPHQFKLVYTVTLRENSLGTELQILNTSETESFEFQVLLHTYFNVPDSSHLLVRGVESSSYFDKTANWEKKSLSGVFSGVNQEVDWLFEKVPEHIQLDTLNTRHGTVNITKKNFVDTVIWNPWAEKAKTIADFSAEEYKNMICIEVGSVAQFSTLAPKQSWKGSQLLEVQPGAKL
eukprot:TRINITY_DN6109_c0_g1_i1.p1 TRINITY_DN6109_c0_g1~~TRINITY_DN6109_c0_g1_i1.p1  ORF type:complete len:295 (+),score=57.89 TRINITY_DN6109_c0_g1_i1:8-892(+)